MTKVSCMIIFVLSQSLPPHPPNLFIGFKKTEHTVGSVSHYERPDKALILNVCSFKQIFTSSEMYRMPKGTAKSKQESV